MHKSITEQEEILLYKTNFNYELTIKNFLITIFQPFNYTCFDTNVIFCNVWCSINPNVMSLKLHLDINPFSTQWENLICSPFLTFTRFSFHFRPSYLCISFPYNEVCHTILPLGNVRTHDVNVLVTNLFTTLLYLFMYIGLGKDY